MNRIASRSSSKSRSIGAVCLGLSALALGLAWLSPAVRADDSAPARAVRLSVAEGQVRITQGSVTVTEQAVANAPLFEGMQIATGDDGRAEIQFEDGSVARLSPDSSLTLTALRGEGNNGDAELTLSSGLAYFELQGGNQSGQMGVHFGDSAVTASGFTVLRVRMDKAPGELAVFTGNAHLDRGNGAVSLEMHGGESVSLFSDDVNRYTLNQSIEPDSWDAWNSDRDQDRSAQDSAQTGAASGFGAGGQTNPAWSDLDANGSWYDVPGQGNVWSPYDASDSGWDPYGYGNWMYTPGYGYLWASGYPWGYMPYQCGLWNYYDGFGWGWAPGTGGCRPWWFGGFYGGPRLGTLPGGYRPPRRPILPRAGSPGRTIPMIAVNRVQNGSGGPLPARDRSTPVTIAGSTVTPLRALTNRPAYQASSAAFASREARVYGNAPRSQAGAARPAYNSGSRAYAPASNGSAPAGRSMSAPSRAPSGGGAAPRAPSGGGSMGGGAPHASGGGGGGGGGGAHK